MKTFIIVIVIAAVLVVGYFLLKKSYNQPSQSSQTTNISASVETNSVDISNFSFNPADITVKAGTAITFTNNDGTTHTVTADNGKFDQQIDAGQSITITVSDAGIYTYHCKIHSNMTGTIRVQ